MHIPDGFLTPSLALTTGAASAVGLGYALYRARRSFPERATPLLGLAAAFVFAAQMLNFPVAGGTSGHLIGGLMVAVLLGPVAAVVVMSAVLLLQCFLFADGGVTALGANIFNMAMVAPLVGYAVYRSVHRLFPGLRGRLLATAFAAWVSTVVASLACAGELALSGIVPARLVFPAMAGVHALIGIGEAIITTLVVAAVLRVRPDLFDLEAEHARAPRGGDIVVYGLLVSLGLAVFVAPFASSWPDGLEKVAEKLGFQVHAAQTPFIDAPLPDYDIPGLHAGTFGTIVAGVVGTCLAFAASYVLARALTPRHRAPHTGE